MKRTGSIVYVEYEFDWPAEQVFDAWLDPDLLPRWMFDAGPGDQSVVDIDIDAETGREFRFCVDRAGEAVEFRGEYICVQRPCRLVFTWVASDTPQNTLVTVEIEPRMKGCRLKLTHDLGPDRDHAIAAAVALWKAEFSCLARVLH